MSPHPVAESWTHTLHGRLVQTTRRALASELHRWPTDAEVDAQVSEIERRHAAHLRERQEQHREAMRQKRGGGLR